METGFKVTRGAMIEFFPFKIEMNSRQKAKIAKNPELLDEKFVGLHNETNRFSWIENAPFCPCMNQLQQKYTDFKNSYGINDSNDSWNRTHCLCRETAWWFSNNGRAPYTNYQIGTITAPFKDRTLRMQVWADYYHERRICILCYNLSLEGMSVSDIIALKAYFSKTVPISDERSADDYFLTLNEELVNAINSRFAVSHGCKLNHCCTNKEEVNIKNNKATFEFSAIEINQVEGCENVSSDVFKKEHLQELYGILTGDEGFEYVPKELAVKRVLPEKNWNTRSFNYLFAYGKCAVALNAKRTSRLGNDYVQLQNEITDAYHRSIRNYYFEMQPCIACVDHCVLDLLEKNICIVCEAKALQKKRPSDDKRLESKRKELLEYVFHLPPTQIEEINDLNDLLEVSFGSTQMVSATSKMLELCSEDSMHNKQTMMNIWILALTIFTALLGCLASGKLDLSNCCKTGCSFEHVIVYTIFGIAVLALVNLLIFYFNKKNFIPPFRCFHKRRKQL